MIKSVIVAVVLALTSLSVVSAAQADMRHDHMMMKRHMMMRKHHMMMRHDSMHRDRY